MRSIAHPHLRDLHRFVRDAIYAGPPTFAGEVFFHGDLGGLRLEELREERRRLELRMLLTDRKERGHWPATWLTERLQRIEEHLGHVARR